MAVGLQGDTGGRCPRVTVDSSHSPGGQGRSEIEAKLDREMNLISACGCVRSTPAGEERPSRGLQEPEARGTLGACQSQPQSQAVPLPEPRLLSCKLSPARTESSEP